MGISHKWNGTILTITSDSGTSSCDLKGAKGDDGCRGAQGRTGLTLGADGLVDTSGLATEEYVDNAVAAISGGGGMSAQAAELLITILRGGVFTSNQSANITALETALASTDTGGEDTGGDSGNTGGSDNTGGDNTGGSDNTDEEEDTRTILYNWDFTKSLVDTVNGSTVTLYGATQDTNGLTLGSSTAYAEFEEEVTNRKVITIEVDFGDMSRTGTAHGRLLMATAANGFIYRNTGSWQVYMDAWSGDTLETNANAFANSTLVIKQSGDFSNSTSGTHYWTVEHNGKVIVEKARASGYGLTLKLGSSSNSYYTAVIKAMRVYEGVE